MHAFVSLPLSRHLERLVGIRVEGARCVGFRANGGLPVLGGPFLSKASFGPLRGAPWLAFKQRRLRFRGLALIP